MKWMTLEVDGHKGVFSNTLMRQAQPTRVLGLVYPGMSYSVDAPLLYYPSWMLADHGADVMLFQRLYSETPGFSGLPDIEQEQWILGDAVAALRAALSQRPYQTLILVGKSLGTVSMAHLAATQTTLPNLRALWLTPILTREEVRTQIRRLGSRSVVAIGTADRLYRKEWVDELRAAGATSVIIDGAGHGLQIPGQWQRSLNALTQVLEAFQALLQRST